MLIYRILTVKHVDIMHKHLLNFIIDKSNKEVAFKEFLRLFKSNTKENDDILKKYLNLD